MKARRVGTVVEVFENDAAVKGALLELQAVGFTTSQIGVVSHDKRQIATPKLGIGTFWGLPTLAGTAPGIGPVIAGGILSVLFWSTAKIGAAGAMIGIGISHDDAEQCEGHFRAGRTIIAVNAGTRADIASSVLNRFNQSKYDSLNRT